MTPENKEKYLIELKEYNNKIKEINEAAIDSGNFIEYMNGQSEVMTQLHNSIVELNKKYGMLK